MVELKGLGKLLKSTTLKIASIEEENTPNTQILRVELAEKQKVEGSMPLPNGKKMVHEDNVIYISQPNDQAEGNITEFFKGLGEPDEDGNYPTDAEGNMTYSGKLKLDVSKPKFRNVNGTLEVVKPAKLWLTQIRFAQSTNTLVAGNRTAQTNELLRLFGQPVPETPATGSEQKITASLNADIED